MQYSVAQFRQLIAGPAQNDHLNSVLFGGLFSFNLSFTYNYYINRSTFLFNSIFYYKCLKTN